MAVQTYTGTVEKIFFSGDTFTAGILKPYNMEKVKFVVKDSGIKQGDKITVEGIWKEHSKYGSQLSVSRIERHEERTQEGIIAYLSSQNKFRGIGDARARLLVETYGDDLEDAIINRPAEVAKKIRSGQAVVENLRKEWDLDKKIKEVEKELYGLGLTNYQVSKIISRYGEEAVDIVTTDPYRMIVDIKGFGFKTVDDIALGIGIPKGSKNRYEAATLYSLQIETERGHTYSLASDIKEQTSKLLLDPDYNPVPHLESLLSKALIFKHENIDMYSLIHIANKEKEIHSILISSRIPPKDANVLTMTYSMMENQEPFTMLNEEQRKALSNTLSSRISIISGGAGTGKSFTINAINKIFRESGKSVVMCAPTGKASRRLEEMTGSVSFTIHMLLGYNGREWRYSQYNKLPADLVVVDEFSMVDVELAWRLLTAIDFTKTCLVVVGDHNQLPSVGPGNILRDLCRHEIAPTVVLQKVIRQAGILKKNSIQILDGKIENTSGYQKDKSFPWYLNNKLSDPEEIISHIDKLYTEVLDEKLGFDILRDVQMLIPMKAGPIGTEAVNLYLRKLIQKKLWNVDMPNEDNTKNKYYLHDKIIQVRNNYDLGIMNGTIGIITEINDNGDLLVDFDDTEVVLRKSAGHHQDIKLAYALTVHKAQGSEFPCTIIVIYNGHYIMHNRNSIYTAVTRASKTCMLLGSAKAINIAVSKRDIEKRRTMLSVWMEEEL